MHGLRVILRSKTTCCRDTLVLGTNSIDRRWKSAICSSVYAMTRDTNDHPTVSMYDCTHHSGVFFSVFGVSWCSAAAMALELIQQAVRRAMDSKACKAGGPYPGSSEG